MERFVWLGPMSDIEEMVTSGNWDELGLGIENVVGGDNFQKLEVY